MAGSLTNKNEVKSAGSPLTNRTGLPFKVAIDDSLENKYCFKDLKPNGVKSFHNFIESTVGEGLTISEVDKLYLRTKAKPTVKSKIHGESREVVHYGKDRKPFRIFGYYNQLGYFVLSRIDQNHSTHKSK